MPQNIPNATSGPRQLSETVFVGAWVHWLSHVLWTVLHPNPKIAETVRAVCDNSFCHSTNDFRDSLRESFEKRYIPNVPQSMAINARELFATRAKKVVDKIQLYPSLDAYFDGNTRSQRRKKWERAIFDCSPDRFHMPHLQQSLARGYHAFVEKPIATDELQSITLDEYLANPEYKDQVIDTCYLREFDAPFIEVKRNWEWFEELVGGITRFRFHIAYPKPRKEWVHSSFLSDHLPHEIHLVNWLFSERFSPNSNSKLGLTTHERSQTTYHVTGDLKNPQTGDRVSLVLGGWRTLNEDEKTYWEYITLTGPNGKVRINFGNGCISYNADPVANSSSWSWIRTHLELPHTDYNGRISKINDSFFDRVVSGRTRENARIISLTNRATPMLDNTVGTRLLFPL